MRILRAALVALCLGPVLGHGAAMAQGWGDLDRLLQRTLAPNDQIAASFWLPDNIDPARATLALGVVYPIIQGAAGNTGIAPGLFRRGAAGWALVQPVRGVFGQSPSDVIFYADRVELNTVLPGPNDPRCCPTMVTRWSIDLASGAAQRLN